MTVDWRLKQPISLWGIAGEVAQENQACAIVNLRAHARPLYRQLVEQTGAESTFFLTTDLCPAHRLAVLREIRERMQAGLPCRLVSTQCIEAGVDLDFPVVFRALAPLDAIIQAAGRCNRNGDSPTGRVIVFVPEEEKLYPSSAYENAANCVQFWRAGIPLIATIWSHIQSTISCCTVKAKGDKQALRQAVEEEDFLEVQNAYQIIRKHWLSGGGSLPGEEKLYQEVEARYEKEGLTPALMRLAGPITVSSFQRGLGPAVLRTAVLPRLGTRRGSCGDGLLSVRHS